MTDAFAQTLVSHAAFITNQLHGSSILNSSTLVTGYTPSFVGITLAVVPQELLHAHLQLTAHRVIQKALKVRNPKNFTLDDISPGHAVRVLLQNT